MGRAWLGCLALLASAALLLFAGQPAQGEPKDILPAAFDTDAMESWEAGLSQPERAQVIRLSSRRFKADADLPLPAGGRITYLTVAGGISREIEADLASSGTRIIGFIGPNTWVLRVGASAQGLRARLRAHGRVIGSAPRAPRDASSRTLWGALQRGWVGVRRVRVLFWRDASPLDAARALADAGATDIQVARGDDGLPTLESRFVDVWASAAATGLLLSNPSVAYVEFARVPRTLNQTSVSVSKADQVSGAPYNLDGTGQIVAIWDGAGPGPHTDFGGRVTLMDPPVFDDPPTNSVYSVNSLHATHVTGTILGDGTGNAQARGFAPAATSFNYDFAGPILSERRIRRHASRHCVDNHSYAAGDENGPFGGYDSFAAESDFDNRDMLMMMCKAAGNEGVSGSNTVFDDSGIKNGFCCASVEDNGITISNFSSRGPADDGRLVPQITSNGAGLLSTQPNNTYATFQGTSMSTPSTSGAIALLSQLWKREHNNMELAPDVARAVLFQTAVDRGNAGPDYQFGFGVVDLKAASDLVLADKAGGAKQIVRGCVEQNGIVDFDLTVPAATPQLKVTLTWLDEPGTPGAGTVLVNDLDLELIDPSCNVHFPYSGLTGNGAQNTAFTQTVPNRRDNAEQAVITTPVEGMWIVRVKAFSLASALRPQGFVLSCNLPLTHNHAFYEDAANPPNNGTAVVIPDGVGDVTRTFNVAETNALVHVRLYTTIIHNTRGQIEIKVRHPDTTEVIVEGFETIGSDANRDGIFAIYPDTRASFASMAVFNGKPANGTWTVTISDKIASTAGSLVYLALELEFDSSPGGSLPPTANAGPDQTVDEGDPVTLDGSGSSDPEMQTLAYFWEQISGTPTLVLTGANTDSPTFTAPQVPSNRTYVFRLTVSDPDCGVSTAIVSITVNNVTAGNLPPTADAGPDQSVAPSSLVTLDGSGSSDPEMNPLTYSWLQIGGANAVSLSSSTAAGPTFTAPVASDTLTFRLTVDDSNGGADQDTVVITVGAGAPPPAPKGKKEDKGKCAATDEAPLGLLVGVLLLVGALIAARRRVMDTP